ncbi:hypothetical protein MTsN3n11_18740 [Qipengyuania sp. MTN3-11]
MREYFAEVGFRGLGYIVPSAEEPGRFQVESHGFGPDWMIRYLKVGLESLDPFRQQPVLSNRPLRISAMIAQKDLSSGQLAFIENARSQGMTDGYLIPTFGIHQRRGWFGLGQVENPAILDRTSMFALQAVAQSAHTQIEQLALESQPIPRLSKREVAILHWIAAGKTNSEIGTILGIKVPTVATYIKRIFQKLELNDRSAAVAKALKLGIIDV